MNNLLYVSTSAVSDLSFVSIADRLDSNWAEWEVEFNYDGKSYVGFLGACPLHPDLMHGEKILDVELA